MIECCDNCKFSSFRDKSYYALYCRRCPPVIVRNYNESHYPPVSAADWCGEWKKKIGE